MAFVVELEPGETLLKQYWYAPPKAEPFSFAISARAFFLPRKKRFAVSDALYFERVPLSDIRSATKVRLRPYGWWVFAAILIVVGVWSSILMMEPILRGHGGTMSGFPPGIAVIGIVVPFAVRGRYAVVLNLASGKFQWKAPIAVDRKSREEIRAIQDGILEMCRKLGVPVEGKAASHPGFVGAE